MITSLILAVSLLGNAPTPDSELESAHAYLLSVPHDTARYIRLFTTYAIPEKVKLSELGKIPGGANRDGTIELRKLSANVLSFVLNSTASVNADAKITRPVAVPNSDTLFAIDIRDYGWTEDQINAVYNLQPYFLDPLVDRPGLPLFRADWFIVNATDTAMQDDRGIKDIAYYILQYGKGEEPKNAADFQKKWLVDIDSIRKYELEHGTVVNQGDSGVSRHTRQLRRGRTILGYYWETRDVKSHDLNANKKSRDYVEDLDANQVDAGEYITTNRRGLQTYLLTAVVNGEIKRTETGDTAVVVDRSDDVDVRVRTGKSCIVCHEGGINATTNYLRTLFAQKGELKTYDKETYRKKVAFYLHDIDAEIEADNKIFGRAVTECNDMTPEANASAYTALYNWYRRPVSIDTAAVETGLMLPEYRKVIGHSLTGRLVSLYRGIPVPRDIWDSINDGAYIQSRLLLKGGVAQKVMPKKATKYHVCCDSGAQVVDSFNRVLATVKPGEPINIKQDVDAYWYLVQQGGVEGFVLKTQVVSKVTEGAR